MSSTALLLSVNVVASNLKREKEKKLENFNVCIRIMQKRESAIFFPWHKKKKTHMHIIHCVTCGKVEKIKYEQVFHQKVERIFSIAHIQCGIKVIGINKSPNFTDSL